MRAMKLRNRIAPGLLFTVLVLGFVTGPAVADDSPTESKAKLAIELNALDQRGSACRLSFLISNKTGVALDALAFELVLFDASQRIISLVAAEAGALPKGKSRVKQFDIAARECTSISRLLLNDITQCKGGTLTPKTCLQAVLLSSRASVPLIY